MAQDSSSLPPSRPTHSSKTNCERFFESDEREDGFVDDSNSEVLSWRGNPEESLSDWKIIIHKTDEGTIQTYHVHRAILGVGLRKSEYFETLFRGSRFTIENQESTSRITLDLPGAADAFPVMLDFMYGGWERIVQASDGNAVGNAVSLRYLANYFRCRALMVEVNKIIERELDETTCIMYLLEAHKFGDRRLVAASEIACAKLCSKIHSDMFGQLPPELFSQILHSKHLACKPCHLSLVVSRYLDHNAEAVTCTLLNELTDPEVMPCIGVEAASHFIGHLANNIDTPKGTNQEEIKQLVKLSYRCSKSLSMEGWRSLQPIDTVDKYFSNTSPTWGKTMTTITHLAAALECAQLEYHRLNSQHKALHRDVSEKERRIHDLEVRVDELGGLSKNEWPYYNTSRGGHSRRGTTPQS